MVGSESADGAVPALYDDQIEAELTPVAADVRSS
jgi:hypothetical protein